MKFGQMDGIFYKLDSPFNSKCKILGTNSNYTAEIQPIAHCLYEFPKEYNIIIYTDSLAIRSNML